MYNVLIIHRGPDSKGHDKELSFGGWIVHRLLLRNQVTIGNKQLAPRFVFELCLCVVKPGRRVEPALERPGTFYERAG